MSEYFIDGVRCVSQVHDLKTGQIVPYAPFMQREITKSILSQLRPAELMKLPTAPKDVSPTIKALIRGDRVIVSDVEQGEGGETGEQRLQSYDNGPSDQ